MYIELQQYLLHEHYSTYCMILLASVPVWDSLILTISKMSDELGVCYCSIIQPPRPPPPD